MPQNIALPGLISLLAAALAQQPTKPLVLALDGRCGSGKKGDQARRCNVLWHGCVLLL